jgi:two-component system phosphate regulon sensor histidine kinase PhoR
VRGDRLTNFLLPAVLVAVGILAYYTYRTTSQLEKLQQQSVIEASLGLATEKADRLDQRIVEQDNAVIAVADPAEIVDLAARWLPTAQRETPTVRAILVLDEAHDVLAFASRATGAWTEEETFRRLVVQRLMTDMELGVQPPDELRHLHRVYDGQSYLVSYWQKMWNGRRYIVVAWHDIGRIVKYVLPSLSSEAVQAAPGSRVNVIDEEGRIIFGPPLRSSPFTVSARFPTTLYNWRLQVAGSSASEQLAAGLANRYLLERIILALSFLVLVAGGVTIVVATIRERRLAALKGDFVANVSHELKTPLSLIRMFSEMLQSGRVASEAKRNEYLKIIVDESERLTGLIENVLDFARVERGKAAFDFASGDVGEAVTRAAAVYAHRAEREGVELSVEVETPLPASRIDERAVQLAVINLIDNALKYAPQGKVIRIRAGREGAENVVRVADEGPGVPPEERQRIFERFVRGSTAASTDRDGTSRSPPRGSGIGLALVQHIATSHGGRAWVEAPPPPQKGATFLLSIPS